MDLIPYLVGAGIAVAVGLLFIYLFMTAETKMAGKASLRAIETYAWQGEELVGTEASLKDRVIAPMNGKLLELGKRFTPVGYVESSRRKLMIAGRRGPEELDKFLAMRALTIGLIPVFALLILFVLPSGGMKMWMLLLMVVILGIGPDARLNKTVQARQKQVRRSLPDILDLLTISVEAGLGFEQAIDRITDSVPGPLSDEFNRMIGEMRAGSSRQDALSGLEVRTGVEEVKSFVLAMIQADTFGVSIGRVLRAQADEMRIKRRQIAHEAAQKAPVKMLIPMTFLIFPALFVVVLGPAVMNIMDNLK